MSTERFHALRARTVQVLRDDIDTDQIIPARFLTTTTRNGLGAHLFADWRFEATGVPRVDCPLNACGAAGAAILVTGRNFGCGSSREHAPWALRDWGFRVIIGTSFADIFRANAGKNGLLTVALDTDAHASLLDILNADPTAGVGVDLERQYVSARGAFRASFEIDPFTKRCLSDGVDELGYLLEAEREIAAYEKARGLPPFDTRPLAPMLTSGALA